MVGGPGVSEAWVLSWFHGILWPSQHRFALFRFNLVAEQAESIDDPLHEAAKRGRCESFRLR